MTSRGWRDELFTPLNHGGRTTSQSEFLLLIAFYGIFPVCDKSVNMIFRTLLVLAISALLVNENLAQKAHCGHPGAPASGNFFPMAATFTVDTVIKYKCDSGFLASGSDQRTCLRNGTWTGQIPICADKNIGLGKVATQSTVFRQQRAGLAVDGLESTCASTPRTPAERWWQVNLGKSVNVSLISVTMTSGASQDFSVYVVFNKGGDDSQIVYSKCGNFSGYLRSKPVEIRCKNGSGLVGQYVFIRDNRQGGFSLTICEVQIFTFKDNATCGQPERPMNTIVKPVNHTTVSYSCQMGFTLIGPQFVQCNNGIWEHSPPFCSETFCRAPPLVPNSVWRATYAEWFPPPDKTHFPFGTTLIYTCNQSFKQDRNSSLVCKADGSWDGIQPKCLPTSCDPPPTYVNASLHFPNNTSPTKIGVKAEVQCDPGFQLDNNQLSMSIECFVNGSWTDNRMSCQIIASYEDMQPALGIILGIITVLVVTGVVVVVLIYLRQRGYLKRSSLWPHHNLGNSQSGAQLEEMHDDSQSKPIGMNETFNDVDEDLLYDDVWPVEESRITGATVTSDGLYADAMSDREHVEQVLGACSDIPSDEPRPETEAEEYDQRIYDQPNDDDCENVYYSPLEGSHSANADGIDRSELPPADGAADNQSRKEQGSGLDEDHIYEPLRRPHSPSIVRTRPVYAKVDVMNKKFRRSLEEEEMAGNSLELRQPPEGVTYTVPVFANNENNPRDSLSGNQRPLPPIPNPPGSRCSVMIDNALYVKGV